MYQFSPEKIGALVVWDERPTDKMLFILAGMDGRGYLVPKADTVLRLKESGEWYLTEDVPDSFHANYCREPYDQEIMEFRSFFENLVPLAYSHDEKLAIAEAWIKFGGGFLKALGLALEKADGENAPKILRTWANYIESYRRDIEKILGRPLSFLQNHGR